MSDLAVNPCDPNPCDPESLWLVGIRLAKDRLLNRNIILNVRFIPTESGL